MSDPPSEFLLPGFRVCRYRLELRATNRLVLPRERVGIILRGAFGLAFRRLVCHDVATECRRCLVSAACPYARVFAPSPPADADRLRLQADIPRPFVLAPDLDGPDEVPPGGSFGFDLTLIGDAAAWLPYFVVAFRSLGDQGIGPGRGRFVLQSVTAVGSGRSRVAYRHGEAVVHAVALPESPGGEPCDGECRRLALRFLTPTLLRADAAVVAIPAFHHLVKRLRDRASAMHYFYCGGPWEIDHRRLGRLAEGVQAASSSTGWVTRARRSSRTGRVHSVSGFVGEVVYEGDLAPFLPLLRVGERIHAGKAATFGNGRFEVTRSS